MRILLVLDVSDARAHAFLTDLEVAKHESEGILVDTASMKVIADVVAVQEVKW